MFLHLENYKSLTNHSFNFSKINILIGENSSGKSSLIKFFLLLKQSMMGFKNKSSFNIAFKGEYFDFGNFKDIISFNNVDNKLIFEFEFDRYHDFFADFITGYFDSFIQNYPQITQDFLNLTSKNLVKIRFEIDSNVKNHSGVKTTIFSEYIGQIELESSVQDNVAFQNDICNITYTNNNSINEYSSLEFEKEAFFKYVKVESLQESIKLQNKGISEEEVLKLFYPISFLLISQNYLEHLLEKIEYINPINSSPRRYFMLEETSSRSDNINLDYIVNALNDEEIFDLRVKKLLLENINEALNFLGIADEIKFEIAENMPIVELKAKIKDFWSNITDVGYGLSLQLPILFRTIIAGIISDRKMLFIEQPEVHLHPSLQSKFIETIIKYGGNNIFYIETHSEHIIRKLQSIVKNKTYDINSSDISINYFKREKSGSTVSKYSILENGKLSSNFPTGFFDTSYLLAKELL